ncbi:MAG: hypothetical protein MSA07_07610 [Mucispirillum sp.]|uniref:Uncharacterized protein n=1 Tax=Candidatus Mucispirillum faecigallinarum TaxID=2838699 RepID=A0A9D2GUZ0_9BACT|nr:hypothetical protein [Mucispirillum sp.]HIZ89456.1 hypothetical protein [Candidatus Mucispirillum faecigallinarum]
MLASLLHSLLYDEVGKDIAKYIEISSIKIKIKINEIILYTPASFKRYTDNKENTNKIIGILGKNNPANTPLSRLDNIITYIGIKL